MESDSNPGLKQFERGDCDKCNAKYTFEGRLVIGFL